MVQDVIHLLCGPAIRSHKAVLRKGLLLMLMVILSGGADATNVGDVLSGSSVYINVGTGYEQPSYLSNLSFTVTAVPPSKFSEGAVSVKPVGPISGKLTIVFKGRTITNLHIMALRSLILSLLLLEMTVAPYS